MLEKLKNIFHILFLKPRLVYTIEKDEYSPRKLQIDDNYKIITYDLEDKNNVEEIVKKLLPLIKKYNKSKRLKLSNLSKKELQNRLHNNNCGVHIAEDKKKRVFVGFYWYLVHRENSLLWHDSFPIPKRGSLVFNAYVHPDYRCEGIYTLLQTSTANYLLDREDIDTIYVVVERSNTASIKANEKFGYKKVAENYLAKLFGYNFLTILVWKNSCKAYHLLGREIF